MPFKTGALTYSAGSVTTTSGTVLAANPSRKYLRITNTNAGTAVWLKFGGGAAVLNAGFGLPAFGSAGHSVEFSRDAGNLHTGLVTAIAAVGSGTATLAIVEGA